MKTKFEIWQEYWDELEDSTKISIRNAYCLEHNADEEIFPFDEGFFELCFSASEPIEIARAVFFGNIQSWNDEYIKFNGYGNLESMSTYDAVKDTEDYYLNEIFEDVNSWKYDIDEDEIEDEYRNQHLEYVKVGVAEQLPDLDPEYIEQWFDDNWDNGCDDDGMIQQCVEYYSDPENL